MTELQPDRWIVEHRAEWDKENPKHDVVLETCDCKRIAIIPNDNSVMGCSGPMWTPEAINFLTLLFNNDVDDIILDISIIDNHSSD